MADNNQGGRQFASMYPNNLSHERVFSRWGRNNEGTASNLNITVTGNIIRIKISTGLSEDKQRDQKTIDFTFGANMVFDFLTIVNKVGEFARRPLDAGPVKQAFGISNYRRGGVQEVGKIVVGRDNEGVLFISGIDEIHGKVKFDLTLGRDVVMFAENSSERASPAEVSRAYTETWADAVKTFLAPIMVEQYVDTQKDKQQQGGGNKGNWNKGGNNGGGWKGNNGGGNGGGWKGNNNNGGGYNNNRNGGGGYNNNGGGNNGGYNPSQQDNSAEDFLP